jgi:hypothetical protein
MNDSNEWQIGIAYYFIENDWHFSLIGRVEGIFKSWSYMIDETIIK